MEMLDTILRDLKLNETALRRVLGQAPADELRTSDVTLVSHAHGRERRAERGIQRRELQAAIKHGVKEKGNPGRTAHRGGATRTTASSTLPTRPHGTR